MKVALSDSRELDADIVLRDQRTDLAVLKLKGGGTFPTMELGDSDALEVGDIALAIGDPFAVGQTVTQGIISALARTNVGTSDYGFFIQTDAAINPGNSGGALVDMLRAPGRDQLGHLLAIGGLGRHRLRHSRQHGQGCRRGRQVRRQAGQAALARREPAGGHTRYSRVARHEPSVRRSRYRVERQRARRRAGIKRGDIITSIDGRAVDNPEGFGFRLATKPLGGTALLDVRRSGRTLL